MNKRNVQIDMLKGIAIILMVFDHIYWGGSIHTYIQSFHMPLFFIVSGYLFKNRDFLDSVKIRAKKLLLPYFVFSFLFLLLKYVFYSIVKESFGFSLALKAILLFPTDIENMPFAPALWFLPCMFITSIVYSLLSKYSNKIRLTGIAVISLTGIAYSYTGLPMLPFAIEPACAALLFFEIGNCAKRIKFQNKHSVFLMFLFVILHSALAFLNICSVDMRSARYNIFPLFVISACLGTAAYYLLTLSIKNNKIINVLSWFGRNSMSFLCTNQAIIFFSDILLYKFINYYEFESLWIVCNIIKFIITMTCGVLFDAVASKTKLKKLIGLQ